MTLIDLLKIIPGNSYIMIDPFCEKRTQIMKVSNIPLGRIKRWLGWNVWQINGSVDTNGEPFTFIAIEKEG